jgi:DNA-binding IclR family transcriptional regulator
MGWSLSVRYGGQMSGILDNVGDSDYSKHVPAADRTLRLLELIARSKVPMNSAVLLQEVGGSRSGLYALLNTLRARGYLVSDDGRHSAGPALWGLLPARPVALDTLVDSFRSAAAAEDFEETVALSWPDGAGMVIVAEAAGVHGVRAVYQTGTRRSEGSADALVLAAGDPRATPELDPVRAEGIAAQNDDEVFEVAGPVCRDGVHPVAAVIAGVPAQRADESRISATVENLRLLATRLSYRLGASVYQPYGWASSRSVGPSIDLDGEALQEFLEGLWSAQLACVRSDGTPHVVPLWYEWDGSKMWLAASPGASWRSHLAENPQVSVTLDEPWPPLRRVFLSGTASEVAPEQIPGGLGGLRRRLATKYLGRGAEGRPELVDTDGWTAIRLDPDRIRGQQGLGSSMLKDAS